MESVSRADFITRMKAIDSGLPRQTLNDLADALCGKTKTITFANMIDFLDIKILPGISTLPNGHFEEEGDGSPREMTSSLANHNLEEQESEDEDVYTVVPRQNEPQTIYRDDAHTNLEGNVLQNYYIVIILIRLLNY